MSLIIEASLSWILRYCATILYCTADSILIEVNLADHVRCAYAALFGRQDTILDQPHHSHFADAQVARCFVQDQLSTLRAFAVSIDSDAVVIAESANTLLGPRVAFGCAHAKPVEHGCNAAVRQQTRQVIDQLFS